MRGGPGWLKRWLKMSIRSETDQPGPELIPQKSLICLAI